MNTQTRYRMTDAELAHVIERAANHWTDGVIATFAVFGVDLTNTDGPSIRPSDYALPQDQWGAIAKACTREETGGIAMAGAMLDFMNYGPSSYDEVSQ